MPEIRHLFQDVSSGKRSQYVRYSDVPRFNIAKYANENGLAVTIQKFSSKFTALMKVTLNFL